MAPGPTTDSAWQIWLTKRWCYAVHINRFAHLNLTFIDFASTGTHLTNPTLVRRYAFAYSLCIPLYCHYYYCCYWFYWIQHIENALQCHVGPYFGSDVICQTLCSWKSCSFLVWGSPYTLQSDHAIQVQLTLDWSKLCNIYLKLSYQSVCIQAGTCTA